MNTLDWAILAACVAAVLNAIILIRVGHRLPGRRSAIWVITCPETRTSVVVEISERQPVSRLAADHSQFEGRIVRSGRNLRVASGFAWTG